MYLFHVIPIIWFDFPRNWWSQRMPSYFFHVFRRVFPGVKHLSIPVPVAWRRFPAGATFESVEGFEWWGWGAGKDQQRLATKAGWAMLGRPRLGLVRFWTLVEAAELLKLEINGINWKNDPTCYEMAGWWLVLAGFNNHSVHVAFLISGVDPKSCWKKHGSLLNWMVYDMVVLGVIYFIAPRRLFCRCRSMYCRSYIAVTRGNTSRRHGVTSRPSRSLA